MNPAEPIIMTAINWILAAISPRSCAIPSDLISLSTLIANLENLRSQQEHSFNVCTFLVVVGVAIEVATIAIEFALDRLEYMEAIKVWREGGIPRPANPSAVFLAIEVFAAVLVAGGVTGEFVYEKKIGTIDTCIQQADNARAGLLQERIIRLQAPRWAFASPLSGSLKSKPTGTVEILFAPENEEASRAALVIETMLGAGHWKILGGMSHPYSEADVRPRMKHVPLPMTLFSRVGGLSDITFRFSPADAGKTFPDTAFPRPGTAADALWRGLNACGFQPTSAPADELGRGNIRLIIGSKQ